MEKERLERAFQKTASRFPDQSTAEPFRPDPRWCAARFLGGVGISLRPGTSGWLDVAGSGLVFRGTDGMPIAEIPINIVCSITAEGEGVVRSGGGFAGGGIGLEGAIAGIAAASMLNALTSRSRMDTQVRVVTDEGEALFALASLTPRRADLWIAPLRSAVRRRDARDGVNEGSVTLADQLEKLSTLKERGFLSDSEFQEAKRRLLGPD